MKNDDNALRDFNIQLGLWMSPGPESVVSVKVTNVSWHIEAVSCVQASRPTGDDKRDVFLCELQPNSCDKNI